MGVGQFFVGDGVGGGQVFVLGVVVVYVFQGYLLGVQFCLCVFYVVVQVMGLVYGFGQVGFGLLQCYRGVGWVQLYQQLVVFYVYVVIGIDGDYGVGYQWGDLYLVVLYVGIVGFFELMVEYEVLQC